MIALSARVEKFAGNFSGHYLLIPEEVAQELGVNVKNKKERIVCHYPDGETRPYALNYMLSGEAYLLLNAKTKKQYHLEVGDMLEISLEKDSSPFGMEMPEVLEVFLEQDPEAEACFLKLTDGAKRSVIHAIASAKREATQINRALKILNNLKEGKTSPREFMR
ncbi:MAG: YdeI/OmpD-associated family protein [Bacteroidota bacterium]